MVDAGHISIESRLADKKAVKEINAKRKQKYSEADYKRLESMMYDRLSVRLQDAQVRMSSVCVTTHAEVSIKPVRHRQRPAGLSGGAHVRKTR